MNRILHAMLFGIGTMAASGLVPAHAADAPITTCDAAAFAAKYPVLKDKTVVMGIDPGTVPYAMIDPDNPGKTIGSDVELADLVFQCMGVKHDLKPGAWAGLFPAVVSGQIDAMFYLYHSPTRAEQGDFITYMRAGSGAIVAKGNPKAIGSKADLCGKTVSAGLGTVEEKQAKTWSDECVAEGKPAITVMTSTDVASGFRLIASGRADVMVSDLPLINMMIRRNPEAYDLAYSDLTPWKIGVAVANGNPIGPAIHEALLIIQAEGKQAEVFAHYGMDPDLIVPSEYLTE